MRVLIGGVGQHNMRDLSLGAVVIPELQRLSWPADTIVEDLSYGPVGVMHYLDEIAPLGRLVLVAGARRGGVAGTVTTRRWSHDLPPASEIQERFAEGATGIVDVDNLLVVTTYFRKIPQDVSVVEVEAEDATWGEDLSPAVRAAIPRLIDEVRILVGQP